MVGSVLLVSLCLGSFGIIEGSITNNVLSDTNSCKSFSTVTCSITNSSITFYHKGGFIVNNWSLLVNGSIVSQGDNFKIGDTITYSDGKVFPSCNCSIRLVGDGSLLFWCEL